MEIKKNQSERKESKKYTKRESVSTDTDLIYHYFFNITSHLNHRFKQHDFWHFRGCSLRCRCRQTPTGEQTGHSAFSSGWAFDSTAESGAH